MPIASMSFETKARTLECISNIKKSFSVPKFVYFTVDEWHEHKEDLLSKISSTMKQHSPLLAVRSSACIEDGGETSMAGRFLSVLNVPASDHVAIEDAVSQVAQSYDANPKNEILVQAMVTDAVVSGVIMTRNGEDGSPYYVFNYDDESGKTDTVTGGTGVQKAVLIHRSAAECQITSLRLRAMLRLAREIEGICGIIPLDIEFGITRDGRVQLFQVRRITTARHWRPDVESAVNHCLPYLATFVMEAGGRRDGLLGGRTIFGNMPDWNPAEIIGATPRVLSASLYRHLVTRSVWREARAMMGYRKLPPVELMVSLGGRPYIDVRCSLNSFLPAELGAETGERLVDAELDRLARHPEFHDRLEFEIAPTVRDFTTPETLSSRYGDVLGQDDRQAIVTALTGLTSRLLDGSEKGSLAWAERTVRELETRQAASNPVVPLSGLSLLGRIRVVLEEARDRGTLPFSVLARHGFIAEALLRSAIARGVLAPERVECLKRSIRTVAGSIADDMHQVWRGRQEPAAFLARYGHLRPGTYDILSPRYDAREDLFEDFHGIEERPQSFFEPTAGERRGLDMLLAESGITKMTADRLFDYVSRAIAGREYGKFVFTRSLSEALERIADWGGAIGLTRDDLSLIPLHDMIEVESAPVCSHMRRHFLDIAERNRQVWATACATRISYLIRNPDDLYIVPIHRMAANFITDRHIEGPVRFIDTMTHTAGSLAGTIVCIENADPGFDWVFTRGIAGLVTKFGGANSHMAVRCAEFALPAAIGCGEFLFSRIVNSKRAELNCANKLLQAVLA